MFLLKWIKWIRNKFASRHQEDPPPSDAATKTDVPDLVKRKISEDPDLDSLTIIVKLYNDSIDLYLGGKANVNYVDGGKDCCTVEWANPKNFDEITKKFEHHQKFLDVFLNDFPSILQICKPYLRDLVILIDCEHFVRSTKKPFWLLGCCRSRPKQWNHSGVPDTTMLQLFENYQKIMNFFDDHPITVKSLQINGLGNSQISQILSKIKTETLSIYSTVGGPWILDFEDIVKLENWRSIKDLRLSNFSVVHPVDLFIDKPALFLRIDEISSDEIRLIMETFRNNPSMEKWNLIFGEDMIIDFMDFLVSVLGQPSKKDEWYFNVSGSEKVLRVSIWWNETVTFSYLNRDKFPEDIEIH